MSHTPANFYVTGGTLRRDAPSYVERRADTELYDGLTAGDYCYVLTSRQMGKSSLMVRTAVRLRADKVAVAVLDLTGIGQNVTPEQWYEGLLGLIGQQLNLEDELEDFWSENKSVGPLQRWTRAITEVLMKHKQGRIVIFVDEIDAVRSLPFSTDEFFAGLREFYNRRTEDAEMERLTVCLLGVATPSDLIKDTRTTPFNIGRRIELTDFTEAEAVPLARGLGRDEQTGHALLHRILYWMGGHPYLTQRLCQSIAEDASIISAGGVDRICEELFLSARARERDDNLIFVRERLLRSEEADRASLLDLYSQVRRHKRVSDDETDPLISVLRLSGVTRAIEGYLLVRNRIYYRVFDREWVRANMPDAELRRQRAAYRKGLLRAAAVAAIVLAVMGWLAYEALKQRTAAIAERNRAEAEAQHSLQLSYDADLNLAQVAWERTNMARLNELLERYRPASADVNHGNDLRGFEWYYYWRQAHSDLLTLKGHEGPVRSVTFSPDGKRLASASADSTIKIWDAITGQGLLTLNGHETEVLSVAFSPDGKQLASASTDRTIKVWDAVTGQNMLTLKGHEGAVYAVTFSPNGKQLASASGDLTIKVWNVVTGQDVLTLKGHKGTVFSVTFSPDGKRLASASYDKTIKIWDAVTGQEVLTLKGHDGFVYAVVFSPDGKQLASASSDKTIKVWNTMTGQEVLALNGHEGPVYSVAFSPDGKRLASASYDQTIKIWDATPRDDNPPKTSGQVSLQRQDESKEKIGGENPERISNQHPAKLGAHASCVHERSLSANTSSIKRTDEGNSERAAARLHAGCVRSQHRQACTKSMLAEVEPTPAPAKSIQTPRKLPSARAKSTSAQTKPLNSGARLSFPPSESIQTGAGLTKTFAGLIKTSAGLTPTRAGLAIRQWRKPDRQGGRRKGGRRQEQEAGAAFFSCFLLMLI